MAGERLGPFNLGRTQMAGWFYLVISAYVLLWLITGNLGSISASLLALMGISAGTALGDVMIDGSKRKARQDQLDAFAAERAALEMQMTKLSAPVAEGGSALAEKAPTDTAGQVKQALASSQLISIQTRLQQITQAVDRIGQPGPCRSEGFFKDILSDGVGYGFHRFQMVAWTVVLMIIFIRCVYQDLRMPEFDDKLLGLIGLSSGTYIGFKFPEK
jgi:hypothetical protein